jgi:gamma-glutamyltranspeptidase
LVIGAPGATQIAMGVLQVTLNVLDFDMTMPEAVSSPRFSATSIEPHPSFHPARARRPWISDGTIAA